MILIIAMLLIVFFLFKLNVKNGKQAIQAFTLHDFMNNPNLNDNTEQKNSLTETINDFFNKDHNDIDIDHIDDDDIGDGGDDGGE